MKDDELFGHTREQTDTISDKILRTGTLLLVGLVLIMLLGIYLTTGCVSASKEVYRGLTETPIPTPEPTEIVTPEPTTIPPTPRPTMSNELFMQTTGGHAKGKWFSISRDNVSGYKDLDLYLTVYGYKLLDEVNWHSVSWNKYFAQSPGAGQKYLFIYAASYTSENSSRTWGIQPGQFYININGIRYSRDLSLDPALRIREFDDTWDYDHVETMLPYGFLRTYNTEKIPTAEALGFIKAGRSNAWDGYIPFVVPADTVPEDVTVIVSLASLAPNQWWRVV